MRLLMICDMFKQKLFTQFTHRFGNRLLMINAPGFEDVLLSRRTIYFGSTIEVYILL